MKFLKLLIVGLLLGLVATVAMLLLPSNKAEAAIQYCSTWNDKVSVNYHYVSPTSVYAGQQVNAYARFDTKFKSDGSGRYIFDSTDRMYLYQNKYGITANPAGWGWMGSWANIDLSWGGFIVNEYDNDNNLVNQCRIKWSAIPTHDIAIIKSAQYINVGKPKIYTGYKWNDYVDVKVYVSSSDPSYQPQGEITMDFYGAPDIVHKLRASVSGNYATVRIPREWIAFNVFDQGSCAGTGNFWDWAAFWDSAESCSSSFWKGTSYIRNNQRYMKGVNRISSVDFRTYNPNIWRDNTGNWAGKPGDAGTWQMGYPTQPRSSSELWNTAVANGGQNDGLSVAGTTTKTLTTRLNAACAKSSSSCNGWTSYGKYGSGSYAWYALKVNSLNHSGSGYSSLNSNYAYFINCEPEGGGRVTFKYYDYGQSTWTDYMYDRMRTNKDKTFNVGNPFGGRGNGTTPSNGILEGFGVDGISSDRWDVAGGITGIYGHALGGWLSTANGSEWSQNWGNYVGELGNGTCAYPYPSAWMPSNISISLPASQYAPSVGTYVYSTVMPVSLENLSVMGGSGADYRALNASPVTINVTGPNGRSRTTNCHAGATTCINTAIPGGPFTAPGDYSVQACWNGQTSPGVYSRVFYGGCSNVVSFRVYQTFACDFPENAPNNITIGPDSQGQVITGDNTNSPKIIRSGDKILVTYPNVTLSNFKGLVATPSPPAGELQIKGRTRIATGSNPYANSDVRLYNASQNEIDANRSGLEWNNGNEISNPVNYISYYWPSAISSSGRGSIQIERRIWVWATAFDPTQPITSPPVTQYWSCNTTDMPHSAWIQIINSQLNG